MRSRALGAFVALLVGATACGRNAPSGPGATASGGPALAASASLSTLEPLEGPLADLWARAKEGEADDLARLAHREGSPALVERGKADATLRVTALKALGYVHDFLGLPWMASVARSGNDAEALAALDSVVLLAAAPRRAVDPEDALELREGCDRLLALARDTKAPRERRVRTIRALRMLSDRGCVKEGDIPTDLDARSSSE